MSNGFDFIHDEASRFLHENTLYEISTSTSNVLDNLRMFASKSFLEKINDEGLSMMKQVCTLNTIPKRFLKKCKLCCFKKRSCFACPSLCKAIDRTCYACGKQGHFPKSRYCHGEAQDGYRISQFDGGADENKSDNREIKMIKHVFAANCEIKEVSVVANFLRKCSHIWKPVQYHDLCEFYAKHKEMSCTYCFFRSCCLRLNVKRTKGPRGLKLNEIVHQLFKYDIKLRWNWRENRHQIVDFIHHTLKLLRREETSIGSLFMLPKGKCYECNEEIPIKTKYMHQVNSESVTDDKKQLSLKDIVIEICKPSSNECCMNSTTMQNQDVIYFFVVLTAPISLNIYSEEILWGKKLRYISHIAVEAKNGDETHAAFFSQYQLIVYQNEKGDLFQSKYGKHENVKIFAISLNDADLSDSYFPFDNCIYGSDVQKVLSKAYLSIINPEAHEKKIEAQKEYDKVRDQTTKRKAMHAEVDRDRDQTPKRKFMHAEIDKNRDKTPKRKLFHAEMDKARDKDRDKTDERKAREKTEERKARDQTLKRKEMHRAIDEVRDKTPARIEMHKKINRKRDQTEERILYYKRKRDTPYYHKKILKSFHCDTGFDVICSSCLQYKNRDYCESIDKLSEARKKRFIVKYSSLLKNRSDGQYVCNLCLKGIKCDKVPKRSKKCHFNFSNFPSYLVQKLKAVCKQNQEKVHHVENDEMKLNKLESFILKLVIPFIRVAHCPRGKYLKVRGDLILISSDISHSLSRILPLNQALIPVCFKRKLSYEGSYLEEFIEKEKVITYFSWFKKYNHHYMDIDLDIELINSFEDNSLAASADFDRISKYHSNHDRSEDPDEAYSSDDSEKSDIQINDEYEPCVNEGPVFNCKTTLFLNKYCENPDIPSVANKLADAIVDYEINASISFQYRNDDENDDEVVSEHEYMKNIKDEDRIDSLSSVDITIQEVFNTLGEDIDIMMNPSEA